MRRRYGRRPGADITGEIPSTMLPARVPSTALPAAATAVNTARLIGRGRGVGAGRQLPLGDELAAAHVGAAEQEVAVVHALVVLAADDAHGQELAQLDAHAAVGV